MNRIRATGHWPILFLLGLAALLVLVFQYVTLAKFAVLPPGLSYITFSRFVEEVQAQIAFDYIDFALVSALSAVALTIVAIELRQRRLSDFFALVFASEKRTRWLLCITILVLIRFYFAPGQLSWGGDASHHIAYAQITALAMAQGEIPIWTNYLGTGAPYTQFYGFLFYYFVGVLDLICRDIHTALKLALASSHLLSGLGIYALVNLACRSRQAGFIAALAYVLSFWHPQQVLIMGRLPLGLFYALLPWPFYFFERLRAQRQSLGALAGGGMALGCLVFVHPGYGFWGSAFFAGYAALRIWGDRQRDRRDLALRTLGLLALGALCGSYFSLGIWLERDSTNIHAVSNLFLSDIPKPTWRHLLGWSNYRFWLLPPDPFHWYGAYLGLSIVGLALLGFSRLSRGWSTPASAAGGGLVAALMLIVAYRWPLLRDIAPIQMMGPNRYLLFVLFFLSYMAGVGAHALLAVARLRAWRRPVFVLLIALIGIDLGLTTFQHLYRPTGDNPTGYGDELYAQLPDMRARAKAKGTLPNYRVFWAPDQVHPSIATGHLLLERGLPTPDAFHPSDLLALFRFYNPFVRLLRADNAAEYSDIVHAGLRLLNVKYYLGVQADHAVRQFELAHTPIVFATRLVGDGWLQSLVDRTIAGHNELYQLLERAGARDPDAMAETLWLAWLIRAMEISLVDPSCERIVLLGEAEPQDLPGQLDAKLLSHTVWNERVEMRVYTAAPCFARLAYAYFPQLRVLVDGREIEPMQTAGHFIALRLEAGEHRIVIEPRLSPLRRGALLLTGLALALIVGLWLRGR